jgi:rare lipoprotein A
MFSKYPFPKIAIFIVAFAFCNRFAYSQTHHHSLKKTSHAHKKKKHKSVTGVASYYSKSLDSSETATGEIFSQDGNTAASNFFRLNTWVRITNLRNGNTAIVRINDRMARSMSKRGRVIDVSHSTAKRLGFFHRGLTRVKVEKVPEGTEE